MRKNDVSYIKNALELAFIMSQVFSPWNRQADAWLGDLIKGRLIQSGVC